MFFGYAFLVFKSQGVVKGEILLTRNFQKAQIAPRADSEIGRGGKRLAR
jgi:hypothetical protein